MTRRFLIHFTDMNSKNKEPLSTFPHKLSSIVFLLLLTGTTFLFVHLCLQLEYKGDILKYFIEDILVANAYLIIIPVIVTSITIFLFRITNPDRTIDSANFRSFYKIMTYGCQ